ncbi:DNA-directed RNA polymerase subunit omega [Sulfobacillus thermosulfidooxidans]|uniref:DNA-directed RNA polymerase subunit omega n=2 Tax=Sulfobacillus thermosulfidooxidans TaxID=28034 RepID=A0A1W1WMI7_SULTA|nr:DNA-directed RNA polymerase subunit omega [Sulfobacillus thermosulfidooxidans]OLZ09741.1 DNA-directed RNA polymerase subunit omega [Sulfobacillus thermosulfidooxidans]OLZ15952.1 DNA-directed RNA polymerase subunit omega [Sulfobacillus thermosulfidooxidans]OLZ18200.1 DNA-directed RNA polymerase subunit omega [Sulfobacillus thermosulfidooxidans]PSR29952.1 MAG: DNA-directed RNA polymerase subunit omega [Sulfobacillus thermosulfidooxidans]SMC07528.1 DNA-directed RNA polymerase subunit omega [Su
MDPRGLTVKELTERHESKYALAVAAARRGRAITEGSHPLVESHASKPVTIALEEIHKGLITVEVPPVGIK